MAPEEAPATTMEPIVLLRWSARRVRPVVLLWVALVFLAFMAVAFFGVRSTSAVKALALAAVGAIVPLVPAVIGRIECRMTGEGLDRRPLSGKRPEDFRNVFRWDELSHVVPTRHGLKFYRRLDERSRIRRFWKLHVSDAGSGEVPVEEPDRERVLDALAGRGIPVGKPLS